MEPTEQQMEQATDIAQLIGSLCRGAWDEHRVEAYARTLCRGGVPLDHMGSVAEELVTKIDPDEITPARLIAAARQAPIARPALPAPSDVPRQHPGRKHGGAVPVEIASDHERARMLVQYAANMRAQGVRFNRPDLAYEARRLGVDASPFEVDDGEVQQRRGESVSEIVQRVLDARRPPF